MLESRAVKAPWQTDTGLESVRGEWLAEGRVRPCLAATRHIPARVAALGAMPHLDERIARALSARGVKSLYSHQVEALSAAQSGRDFVIATPTASGKSLCFHLPVLDALARDPSRTALFLYPTKALSRDQEHGLQSLIAEAGLGVPGVVFDGDTPGDQRAVAREKARVLLTNPDMLHAGILPNHAKWASFLSGLSYVVLDELHTYRGVFGSHMAHVIARLKRLAAFHGARPVFIGATATIGNPREHAARIFGKAPDEVVLIDQSGAPSAEREVFIYNPPIVNAELGVRRSTLKASVELASDLVTRRVSTILFSPSRNSVEVMLKYLRERAGPILQKSGIKAERAIMGYRGGYLPAMRREIERGLREGEILAVVSTNALELGIDIGDLDAVICAGYPGTVAGTWQRFGRAGRRGARSIAVLVCGSGAVDQYLAREPTFLLDRPSEQALIEPENPEIVLSHLKCAAFEAPFEMVAPGPNLASPLPAAGETYGALDLESTRGALDYLAGLGILHAGGGRYHFAGDPFPASNVSLRNVGWDNFIIVDQGTPEAPTEKTIGELDYRATHTMLHEQAIYQQDAEQYQVERLDFDNHKAYVRKVLPDYFTTALTYRKVNVLGTIEERPLGRSSLHCGDIRVTERVTGYKKIKFFTHENSGYGDVHLPEMEMHTTSFWITFPERVIAELVSLGSAGRSSYLDAISGFGQALETIASLSLMCDTRDLGRTLNEGEEAAQRQDDPAPAQSLLAPGLSPTLHLFDSAPGGVGLAGRIFTRAEELIGRARELILACPCEWGCPACVGPTEGSPRKRLALELIEVYGLARTLH